MANLTTTSYFSIEKADRNADGTMTVYGKATDDSLDIDQQICDGEWLDRAMPHWFKSGGNIREQHSNIAAGVAKEYEAKTDGHYITALVVDPVSVKKVDSGVLKGFSIGIKNPRVVRDHKAANGRIVDGQIVEVSLVDRPANPNCQLVLAKSASGDETVIQVEELHETSVIQKNNLIQSANKSEKESDSMEKTIISIPKSIVGDLLKFDKTQFEAAREALANLISVEAQEMKQGSNEIGSISHLLEAVAHLAAWYEGEKAEGEVMEETDIELSADTEKADYKMCKKCDKSMKECMCDKSAAAEDITPTGETGANLDTATIVPPSDSPKSAEVGGLEVADTVAEEAQATEEVPAEEAKEVSADENSADKLEAIVEEVVDKATKALKSEIANLVSAKEAAEARAMNLETELATAKSLAIGGGPKRTANPIDVKTTSDLLTKAAVYKAKAQATTDPVLAKGYKQLAEEFLSKHDESLNK
jgi:hypothetical protein